MPDPINLREIERLQPEVFDHYVSDCVMLPVEERDALVAAARRLMGPPASGGACCLGCYDEDKRWARETFTDEES